VIGLLSVPLGTPRCVARLRQSLTDHGLREAVARVVVSGTSGEPFAAVVETHAAVVYFAGGCAFKLKKPVDLGFLDFSSPQAREAACYREVELNRRFAPDIYLGVVQLRDPAGRLIDHLVMMRRLPAGRRLSALVRAGEPVTGPLRGVARQLAAQHVASPHRREITEQGSRDALRRRWEANFSQARALVGSPLDPATIDEVQRLAGRFLAGRQPLFEARMRAGHIVDGHGDLLADDIFCLDDGPRILDCLEFDDRLRWLDGLDDAACLAMDLERLGAPGLAERFTGWYAEFTADPAPPSLHQHYVAYRAFMRAKVAGLRCSQGDQQAAAEARSLAGIALRHLRAGAVTLALVGGLPGTGKSTLARQLADRLGCTVLNSDRIRKELAGITPGQPCRATYGAGIYAPAWTERTYAELLRRAARLLGNGESVIADASWISPQQRSVAAAVAESAAADLVQLRCTAPAALASERMTARTDDPSDADPQIAAEIAAAQAPWPEAVTIDKASADDPVAHAIAAIRPDRPGHLAACPA
jgi:aminoglycoside phosphotransferase family enzyme/predicted kinase